MIHYGKYVSGFSCNSTVTRNAYSANIAFSGTALIVVLYLAVFICKIFGRFICFHIQDF